MSTDHAHSPSDDLRPGAGGQTLIPDPADFEGLEAAVREEVAAMRAGSSAGDSPEAPDDADASAASGSDDAPGGASTFLRPSQVPTAILPGPLPPLPPLEKPLEPEPGPEPGGLAMGILAGGLACAAVILFGIYAIWM